MPFSTRRTPREPSAAPAPSRFGIAELLLGVLVVSLSDGIRAFQALTSDAVRLETRVGAFVVASALVASALGLVLAIALAARGLVHWAPQARDPRVALRKIAVAGFVGAGLVRASIVGRALVAKMAPAVAVPLTVLLTAVLVGAGLVVGVWVARLLERIPTLVPRVDLPSRDGPQPNAAPVDVDVDELLRVSATLRAGSAYESSPRGPMLARAALDHGVRTLEGAFTMVGPFASAPALVHTDRSETLASASSRTDRESLTNQEERRTGAVWVREAGQAPCFVCKAEPIALLAIVFFTLRSLLPNDGNPYLGHLAWGVLAIGLGRWLIPGRLRLDARLANRKWLATGIAAALGSAGLLLLPHLPGRARVAIYYRTGFAGTLASLAYPHGLSHLALSPRTPTGSKPTGPPTGVVRQPAATTAAAHQSPQPDVVVLHLDTFRADHLGFVEPKQMDTPALTRFRETATWFKNAYTVSPSTRYAMASIFTGLDAGHVPFDRDGSRLRLQPQAETLAEHLNERGYETLGVTFPYVTTYMPGFDQGFRSWSSAWTEDPPRREMDARSTDAAWAAVTSHDAHAANRPLFLYAHYMCGHEPYLGAPTDSVASRYAATIAECDRQVGRLLEQLETRSRSADTLIVVLSDHGEMLGEHGLFFHGTALYEPLLRVPLMVRWASVERPVAAVEANVSLMDIAPAILAAADAHPLAAARVDRIGSALGSGSTGHAHREPVFFSTDDHVGLVRVESEGVLCGDFKYTRDITTGAEQLTTLSSDHDEHANYRHSMPEVRDQLVAKLNAWRRGAIETCDF